MTEERKVLYSEARKFFNINRGEDAPDDARRNMPDFDKKDFKPFQAEPGHALLYISPKYGPHDDNKIEKLVVEEVLNGVGNDTYVRRKCFYLYIYNILL